MNGTLSVLVADPDARVVETDTGTWIVSGVDADALERCVREADAVDDVRASVTASAEDAVLVNVHDDAGRTVHAYRPVVGSRRPYYLRTRDGGPVVTNSLRNALAQLPVEARTVPDEHRESVLHDSGRQAWNVLTYAVWRDRVQRNPDLSVVPSTDRLEWSIPADGRTTVELGGE